MLRVPLRFACVLSLLVALSGLRAGTFTWSGPVALPDGNFSNAANWVEGTAPPNDGTADVRFGDLGRFDVHLDTYSTGLALSSIVFSDATSRYYRFDSSLPVSLTLQNGIAASAGGYPFVEFANTISFILPAAQTWTFDGSITVNGTIQGAGSITKAGGGDLTLNGNNSQFTGNIVLAGGVLSIMSGNALGAGDGTLEIRSGATLRSIGTVTVANNMILENGAVLGTFAGNQATNRMNLQGAITLPDAVTQLVVAPETRAVFTGAIDATNSATAFTISGGGSAIFETTSNLINIGSASAIEGSGLVFNSVAALNIGSIKSAQSYIGMGSTFDGSGAIGHSTPAALIAKIDATTFTGTIGFDSDPQGAPVSFTGTINVSGFDVPSSHFMGLGSASHATIASSAILNFGSYNYKFGGGGGRLVVGATLQDYNETTPVGLSVVSPENAPLTLVLQGTNTFTGTITVDHSFLIFDSINAFPATNPAIQLAGSGYVSGTEYWNRTPNSLLGLIDKDLLDPTAIVGFDSSQPATVGRLVEENIDLSTFTILPYLGTTTSGQVPDSIRFGLVLTGAITVPDNKPLKLAGVNRGTLHVESNLDNGQTALSVVIGHPDPKIGNDGSVVLANGNTYSGGTTLQNGTLRLGGSSSVEGPIVAGPVGTGNVTVAATTGKPRILPHGAAVTLHNNISVSDIVTFGERGGTAVLSLEGIISGAGALIIEAETTLNGSNTYSGGTMVFGTTLNVGNDQGLAGGDLQLETFFGQTPVHAQVRFLTQSPVIAGLDGDNGTLVLAHANGTNLTLNTPLGQDSWFQGAISGGSGRITKTGLGSVTFRGANTYGGPTNISNGTLIAAHSSALGSGQAVLERGRLIADKGVTISNPIAIAATGDLKWLGGNGTFTNNSSLLSLIKNTGVAPGESVGTLTFGTSLTFSESSTYEFEIKDANGTPGFGYDTIVVTGTLAFAATTGQPLTIYLKSLTSDDEPGDANFAGSQSYSWQIASAQALSGFGAMDATTTNIIKTGFTNDLEGGSFWLFADSNALFLNFTPVPEPSTWALLITGLAIVGIGAVRRRRRAR